MNESICSESDVFDEDFPVQFKNGGPMRPRLESRMFFCLPSKGLLNAPGENNCFLNASVQVYNII